MDLDIWENPGLINRDLWLGVGLNFWIHEFKSVISHLWMLSLHTKVDLLFLNIQRSFSAIPVISRRWKVVQVLVSIKFEWPQGPDLSRHSKTVETRRRHWPSATAWRHDWLGWSAIVTKVGRTGWYSYFGTIPCYRKKEEWTPELQINGGKKHRSDVQLFKSWSYFVPITWVWSYECLTGLASSERSLDCKWKYIHATYQLRFQHASWRVSKIHQNKDVQREKSCHGRIGSGQLRALPRIGIGPYDRVFTCCLHDPLIPPTFRTCSTLCVLCCSSHGMISHFLRIPATACPSPQNFIPCILACMDFPSFDQHIVHHPFCPRPDERCPSPISITPLWWWQFATSCHSGIPWMSLSTRLALTISHASAVAAPTNSNTDSGYVHPHCWHSAPQSYHSPGPSGSCHHICTFSTTHRRVYHHF